MVDCAGAAADNYVGLAKGTYYVSLQSHYQFRPSTTYRFSFEKNNACELEPNEKKNDAVDMKVNTMYTGFMENTYAGEKDNDVKQQKQIFSGHLWGQRISVCHPVMCLLRLIQELIMHM